MVGHPDLPAARVRHLPDPPGLIRLAWLNWAARPKRSRLTRWLPENGPREDDYYDLVTDGPGNLDPREYVWLAENSVAIAEPLGDAPDSGIAGDLERLAALRQYGVLTESEFLAAKEKLLGV